MPRDELQHDLHSLRGQQGAHASMQPVDQCERTKLQRTIRAASDRTCRTLTHGFLAFGGNMLLSITSQLSCAQFAQPLRATCCSPSYDLPSHQDVQGADTQGWSF
eukprot:1160507-Pelagomonas_calceolata.AAC.2